MAENSVSDRRQRSERRQFADRRRQGEGRYAIFEVCRSMLHLALVARSTNTDDGVDRVVTRSVRWRKEATSLSTEQGIRELTEAFRTLVAEERLAGAKVHIALNGEFCVTRVLTGPTDDVRREYAELEERSLRYLTLGPGKKTLAGSTQQLDARHQHALLAVANQRTIDVLMRIADATGLQIGCIEPSLIALSRAQSQLRDAVTEACLLIQLDEDVAELGICHGGRLLLEYRPGGHTNAGNIADVAAQHISRLQRFTERYHSYLDTPLRHVYLAGDSEAVAQAAKKFERLTEFHVHVLEPADIDMPWGHAAEVPGTNLSATLGTAMALYSDASVRQGPNLIETALAQLREPIRPVLIHSSIPLAAVVLAAIGLFLFNFKQSRELAAIRAGIDELAPVCTRATELRLNLATADVKLTNLQALDRQLPQLNWQQVLSRLSQSMPDDVWLDRLAVHDAARASLAGASFTDGGVYNFVNYLKQVPDIAEIALEGTGAGQSPTGPTTNFTLQLTLADIAGGSEKEAHRD